MTDSPVHSPEAKAPVAGGGEGSPPTRCRRLRRLLLHGTGILLVTLFAGEAATRWILGIRPLTLESLVWEYHPRRGWAHRPGVEDTFVKLGCRQPIRINSRGLREREIDPKPPSGVQRVLVLGDSAVVGFEVPQDRVYTRVAEAVLSERGYSVEFINAGCRGYGTDQALLYLEEEGLSYEPDLVLYHWNTNDVEDNRTIHRPFRRFGKPYFVLDEGSGPSLRGVPVPDFPYSEGWRVGPDGRPERVTVSAGTRTRLWVRDHVLRYSSFATALAHVAFALPRSSSSLRRLGSFDLSEEDAVDRKAPIFGVTSAMIGRMRGVSEARGAAFRIIGSDDDWARALKKSLALPDLGERPRFLESIPAGESIRVAHDPHWNELGHRLYGEALAGALIDAVLVIPADGARATPALVPGPSQNGAPRPGG